MQALPVKERSDRTGGIKRRRPVILVVHNEEVFVEAPRVLLGFLFILEDSFEVVERRCYCMAWKYV